MSREQQEMTNALMGVREIAGVSVIVTHVDFEQRKAPNGLPGVTEGRFHGVISGPLGQGFRPGAVIMSAREAMRQAIELAQLGEPLMARLWLEIATELRRGEWLSASAKGIPLESVGEVSDADNVADQIAGYCRGQQAPPTVGQARYARARVRALDAGMGAHHADERSLLDEILQRSMVGSEGPERAETVVMRRVQEEVTPAYDAAGESLGETRDDLSGRIPNPRLH